MDHRVRGITATYKRVSEVSSSRPSWKTSGPIPEWVNLTLGKATGGVPGGFRHRAGLRDVQGGHGGLDIDATVAATITSATRTSTPQPPSRWTTSVRR